MPPRLPFITAALRPAPANNGAVSAFLLPFFTVRHSSILGRLNDRDESYKKRIRRGRGPSSGKGKTSGRGHKGQKQHGKVPARFQGGQTPQDIVHSHKGQDNHFSVEMSPINLNRIQQWIDQGRLDPTKPITLKELADSRCLHGVKDGVKLLARGKEELKTPINILVSRASAEAIKAVEDAGGNVTTRYYTKESVRRVLQGISDQSFTPLGMEDTTTPILAQADAFRPRLPDPTSRKDIEYYRDPAHRGYMSHMIQEGQGPSLFFKAPGVKVARTKKVKKEGGIDGKENKLW